MTLVLLSLISGGCRKQSAEPVAGRFTQLTDSIVAQIETPVFADAEWVFQVEADDDGWGWFGDNDDPEEENGIQ